MRRIGLLLLLLGCDAKYPTRPSARAIFDKSAPSVVAITNDDRDEREAEAKELERSLGDDAKAPRHVVDVSIRKEPMPDGTGFMVEGGFVVTAAHVVDRPDRLKLTTRAGKTVDAELVRIDEVRDVALLKPKEPLPDVPPIPIEETDVSVGEPLWAMGHTGRGYWALSWGMSEGIASGVVEVAGSRLLLFDTAVYPGFSGGPVVTYRHGEPRIAGVNHAILYTNAVFSTPVFSGVAATELRAFIAGKKSALEDRIAAYAREQRDRVSAQLFITDKLAVQRAPSGEQVAFLKGDARALDVRSEARVPVVAMLFNLKDSTNLTFTLKSPKGAIVASQISQAIVQEGARVQFLSTELAFTPKEEGRHMLEVSANGKIVGRAAIALEVQGLDESMHDHEANVANEEGDPDVDFVVADGAEEEPLTLAGVRSTWVAKSLPRRVPFAFFARGSRGWSGSNVLVAAYLVDQDGKIAGASFGCLQDQISPRHTWTCKADTGRTPPLVMKPGRYDVVLTMNGRPVAFWPMTAQEKASKPTIMDMERWLGDVRKGSKR